jgi:hypothetical protein
VDHQRGRVEFERGGSDWGWGDYGRWAGSDRFCRQFAGVMVLARAGYETVPADVAVVCNELVKEAFNARLESTHLQSEKIGDYSYTIGPDQAAKVRQRLAAYLDAGAVVGTSA